MTKIIKKVITNEEPYYYWWMVAWEVRTIPVIDNLLSDNKSDALSANQGRVLKQLLDWKATIDDIPTVNNWLLSITVNGWTHTFRANQSGNTEISIDTWATIWNVIDNLTSTSTSDWLSANQGRVLKGLIDGIEVPSALYAIPFPQVWDDITDTVIIPLTQHKTVTMYRDLTNYILYYPLAMVHLNWTTEDITWWEIIITSWWTYIGWFPYSYQINFSVDNARFIVTSVIPIAEYIPQKPDASIWIDFTQIQSIEEFRFLWWYDINITNQTSYVFTEKWLTATNSNAGHPILCQASIQLPDLTNVKEIILSNTTDYNCYYTAQEYPLSWVWMWFTKDIYKYSYYDQQFYVAQDWLYNGLSRYAWRSEWIYSIDDTHTEKFRSVSSDLTEITQTMSLNFNTKICTFTFTTSEGNTNISYELSDDEINNIKQCWYVFYNMASSFNTYYTTRWKSVWIIKKIWLDITYNS